MAAKLLVSVFAQGATLARWRGGQLVDCAVFDSEAAAVAAFEDAIAAAPTTPVHLLVDAVEEDYRLETLPHVLGRERAQLLARRLRQIYRGNPYCAALPRGRDTGPRRDDRWLIVALTNAEIVSPWLEAAARLRAPLAGVHLLPLAYARLPFRLRVAVPDLLLVGETEAGLRQTYFQGGELRLSRLTPHQPAYTVQGSAQYAEQIENTRRYLESLRLIEAEAPLPIVLLDPQETLGVLADRIGTGADGEPRVVRAAEIAAAAGVREATLSRSHDALALALLAARGPDANLAPPAARATYRRHRVAHALYAGAGAVGVAAIGFAGAMLVAEHAAREAAERAHRETLAEHARYEQVTRGFPAAPASGAEMRLAVDAARRIDALPRSPQRGFAAAASALEAEGGIALRSITWRSGAALPAASGAAPPAPGAAAAPPAQPSRDSPAEGEHVILEGELPGFAGDLRAAIATIERLAARLRADPAVASATVLRLPLDPRPDASLSGTTREDAAAAKTGSPTFSVLVRLRARDPS